MMPLSLAVAGPVADALGVRQWYAIGGAVFALLGIISFFVPAIVNIEKNGNGVEEERLSPASAEIVLAGE